jgi:hypothetical protein
VSHPTPYFALYGTAPIYDHLRVFGCACYPNISATAPHKLSPRSTRCLFLGYSSDHKGYRCLDLASNRIIISRHVVFDEDVFPLAGPSPPTDLDSLVESDPVSPSSQAPRLAPLPAPRAASTPRLAPIPAPRAAPLITPAPRVAPSTMPAPIPAPRAAPSTTPVPRATPSTPPAPRATPSTPTARFADLALVYHRRRHITTSAPADSGPSTSPVRFVTPPSSITAASRPRPQPLTSRQTAPSHRCTTRSPSTVTPGRPPDGDPAHRRHSSTCRPTDLGS